MALGKNEIWYSIRLSQADVLSDQGGSTINMVIKGTIHENIQISQKIPSGDTFILVLRNTEFWHEISENHLL